VHAESYYAAIPTVGDQPFRRQCLNRGFTVLMIAPIHTVLVYSKLEVRESWLGYILGFIAEGPGAQLFMLLTGNTFSVARKLFFIQGATDYPVNGCKDKNSTKNDNNG
jgi:hypothetical protein